jgi:hypothetical protein
MSVGGAWVGGVDSDGVGATGAGDEQDATNNAAQTSKNVFVTKLRAAVAEPTTGAS